MLNGALTANPATSPLNAFLVNALESNGGLFTYNTREYLASGRFDHRFSDANQISSHLQVWARPGRESRRAIADGLFGRQFDPCTMTTTFWPLVTINSAPRRRTNSGCNLTTATPAVIPNEPGEAGLQIPGFVNNLGTNIFLPELHDYAADTKLRTTSRWSAATIP